MEARITKNDRVTLASFRDPATDRMVQVPIAAELLASTAMGRATAAVVGAVESVVEHTNALSERLKPEVLGEDLRPVIKRAAASPVRAFQSTALAELRTLDAAEARLREIPNDQASVARRIEARAIWRGLSAAEKARRLPSLNLEQIQAITELPLSDTGTPGQFGDIIRERQLVLSHIRLSGLQADHARQPSAADPLASGPDHAACEAASREALNVHRQRRATVDLARSTLSAVVDAVSLIGGLDRDAAYALLTAE